MYIRSLVVRKGIILSVIMTALLLGRIEWQLPTTEPTDNFPAIALSLNNAMASPDACAEQGCASAQDIAELTATIQQLQIEIAALKTKIASLENNAPPSTPSQEMETAAQNLLREVQELMSNNDIEAAKAKLLEMEQKYSATRIYRRASKIKAELDVFGKKVPTSLGIEEWYTGYDGIVNLNSGTTLVVFWEVWCPHCKRELPNLQRKFNEYQSRGLQVLGLTKLTRSSTNESVMDFISSNGLTYPIAKENGEMSKHFNVSGIPAAAVVKDGVVVWRGHPARLSNEMLDSWL